VTTTRSSWQRSTFAGCSSSRWRDPKGPGCSTRRSGPSGASQGGNDTCGQKTYQRGRFSPSTPALRCGLTPEDPGPDYADLARPERLCGALGSVEPDCWIHSAVVGPCRVSNSTGVSMPSAECRRWRLRDISRYSKMALAGPRPFAIVCGRGARPASGCRLDDN